MASDSGRLAARRHGLGRLGERLQTRRHRQLRPLLHPHLLRYGLHCRSDAARASSTPSVAATPMAPPTTLFSMCAWAATSWVMSSRSPPARAPQGQRARGQPPSPMIEVIKDSKVIYSPRPRSSRSISISATKALSPVRHFHYVRLQQDDEMLAWSSPMFINYK